MQSHPEHSEAQQPPSSRSRVLAGLGIAAILVILVVVHLTGVLGSGTH